MSRQNVERPVYIDHYREPAQWRLVVGEALDSARREAVEDERGDTHAVQELGPVVDVAGDPAGAVYEDDRGQALRARLRDAKLSGDDHRLAFAPPTEELLIRKGGRREREHLDPRDLRARCRGRKTREEGRRREIPP